MLQTLMVRLVPDAKQHTMLLGTVEEFNTACNHIAAVAFREKCFNTYQLHTFVYYDVREKFRLSSQMAVRAIGKVTDAYKVDRTKQCSFRKRGAVPYDQRILSWKGLDMVSLLTIDGRIRVPLLLGNYQKGILADKPRRGQADLIYRDKMFFLAVVVEVPEAPEYMPAEVLGVDMGVKNIAVDSDGTVHTSEDVERMRMRLDRLKSSLQSKGTPSARRHLCRLRRKEAHFSRQVNHCISRNIVARAEGTKRAVAIEELGGIHMRTTVRRPQRRRHLSWSFAQLRSFVEYKAAVRGVPVFAVDPRNTSRTCPRCGTVDRKNRATRDEFRCVSCGLAGPADSIAAVNIAARAGVDRPIVAGNEERWTHFSDPSYKPPISIGGS